MTVSQHAEPEPATRLHGAAVAFATPMVCGLLALGVRLWHLGEKSIWVDEGISWRAAHMPMVVRVSALSFVPLAMLDISIVRTPVFNLKQVSPYIPGLSFVAAIGVVEAGALVRQLGLSSRLASGVSLVVATLIAMIALRETVEFYGLPPGEDWRAATASVRDAQQPVYI